MKVIQPPPPKVGGHRLKVTELQESDTWLSVKCTYRTVTG